MYNINMKLLWNEKKNNMIIDKLSELKTHYFLK